MKRHISLLLCGLLILLTACSGGQVSDDSWEPVLYETADRLVELIPEPTVGSTGGEWLVIGLSRSDTMEEGYGEAYYGALEDKVIQSDGKLSETRYTEYARVVLALTALGRDPADVAGFNLLLPLEDTDQVLSQGINGAIYALLALDSGGYISKARGEYVEEIYSRRLSDGGFALMGDTADPDVTAMAILALAPYRDQENIEAAIQSGISCLANMQLDEGGFDSASGETAESTAAAIIALCGLGIGIDDERFIRQDRTLMEILLDYYQGGGNFAHTVDSKSFNLMSTEQALLALTAYQRYTDGRAGLYQMTEG